MLLDDLTTTQPTTSETPLHPFFPSFPHRRRCSCTTLSFFSPHSLSSPLCRYHMKVITASRPLRKKHPTRSLGLGLQLQIPMLFLLLRKSIGTLRRSNCLIPARVCRSFPHRKLPLMKISLQPGPTHVSVAPKSLVQKPANGSSKAVTKTASNHAMPSPMFLEAASS